MKNATMRCWPTARMIGAILLAFGVLFYGRTDPALSQTPDPKTTVRDINEIIGVLGASRGTKKGATRECEALIDEMRATGGPSKKQRDAVRDCTDSGAQLDFAIPFAFNSAEISKSGLDQLEKLGRALESSELKEASFIIAGHTDRKGGAAFNIKLSQRRAESVRNYLIENFAIKGRRLTAIGYGFEVLKVPDQPYADENRRVEVIRTD